ncbi:MAG: YtxH domain-containing protein [Actinomycetota bacterium]|nr:YtxH domain-containing protein [Actinomycetota bacterium]
MSERRFGYEEFGLGLFLGLLLGTGVGLLLAPQPGAATRRQIAACATDLKNSAEELIGEAKKSLETATSKAEGVLGLQEKRIRRKLEELRAELEEYGLNEA